jgi:hypothetical protein
LSVFFVFKRKLSNSILKTSYSKSLIISQSINYKFMKKILLGIATFSIITMVACNGNSTAVEQQKEIDSLNAAALKQKTTDSLAAIDKTYHEESGNSTSSQNAGDVSNSSTDTKAQKEKKGMSTPLKGALIGAGVGAVSGAVIDKKHRGAGAAIGGILGAGAGAGAGALIDKKKAENSNQ